MQPLLVSTSALELATETVALILRIDDIQVGHVGTRFPDRSRLMTSSSRDEYGEQKQHAYDGGTTTT